MEWWVTLILVFVSLMTLMATGLPVAYAFLGVNIVGIAFLVGYPGFVQLISSIYGSVATFILMPVAMFFLMGELMVHTGTATSMIDAVDKSLGGVRGRLSYLAVGSGTLLSVLTGVPMASVAIMGRTIFPEMERRGYARSLSIGPILGSGGLAMLIPPSAMAVLLGSLSGVSVSKLLIAGIVPGISLAAVYCLYIWARTRIHSGSAPAYAIARPSLREKLWAIVRHILPLGIVVFLVIGVILTGLGTPTEAAALGVFGVAALALINRRLQWSAIKEAFTGSARLTTQVLLVVASSTAFSQMLSYSQATKGLVEWATTLPVGPSVLVGVLMLVCLLLGCFLDVVAIMMIVVPIFFPIVDALGLNPLWFAVLLLLNMEIAPITPPFGMELFVMRGVVPPEVGMGEIYRAAVPFVLMNTAFLVLMLLVPEIVMWVPGKL